MATPARDRSRYFVIDLEDDRLLYTADAIIEAIIKRYPTVNFIRIRGNIGWNERLKGGGEWVCEKQFQWKHVWIQQSKNALNKDCLIKHLLKDLPGIDIEKNELDHEAIKDQHTQLVKIWGAFHTPAKHKSAHTDSAPPSKRLKDMTNEEKMETTIAQQSDEIMQQSAIIFQQVDAMTKLQEEIACLKETITALVGINSSTSMASEDALSNVPDVPRLMDSARSSRSTAPLDKDARAAHIKAIRKLSESTKKVIAGRQNYKCANSPGSHTIQGYNCDRWVNDNGDFNQSGYDIDHVKEVADGGGNDMKNLQALCPGCHRVKTISSSRDRTVSRKSNQEMVK